MSAPYGEDDAPESDVVRVLLVDDQPLLLEGIAIILAAQPGIEVVGRAASGQEAVEAAARLAPDVVCMDVQMPGMDGIEATRVVIEQAERAGRQVQVLVLTTFNREDYLIAALQAGASGFLLKTARPEHLADAIRSAAAGDALLAPEVTRAVIRRAVARETGGAVAGETGGALTAHGRQTAPAGAAAGSPTADLGPAPLGGLPPEAESLTDRELDVLRLVAEGLSNSEIAEQLFIGRATVKTHVSNLLLKLGLRDRVQVVAYAYRHGVITPD